MNMQIAARSHSTVAPQFTPVQGGLLQRKCACGGTPGVDGECVECRHKRLSIQRGPAHYEEPTTVPPIVYEVLRSPGLPLDAETRAFMEPRFGHDFSQVRVPSMTPAFDTGQLSISQPEDAHELEAECVARDVLQVSIPSSLSGLGCDFSGVRIHTDARSAESARKVNARAYTIGRDMVFGAEQYRPETVTGRELLAHELTHVVQSNAHQLHRVPLRRSVEADAARIESLLSYGVFDWAITDAEAIEALDILSNLPPTMQQAVLRRINIGRLRENLSKGYLPILERILTEVGEPPHDVRTTVERIQNLLSYGLFDWAITDREATEALTLLLALPSEEQRRVILVINYQRLYDNLPTEAQKVRLRAIRTPAVAIETSELTTMEGHRTRARTLLARIKANAAALPFPSPPTGGAFETWLSHTYLSEYCARPSSQAASKAIDNMTQEGAGGFTHYGFGLLRDLADRAGEAGIGYIDTPYLLGPPNPGSVGSLGLFDPWSQGPNPTQLMHFAAGIKWSWAPAFLVQWYFVHYEEVSEEGWQIFGLDSLNDIIAEEGARIFAEDLKSASVTCSGGVIDLDPYFSQGRAFLRSKLSEGRLDQLALRVHQPNLVVPVDAQGRHVESRPLWNKTIMEQIIAGVSDADILVSPDAKILTLLYQLVRKA